MNLRENAMAIYNRRQPDYYFDMMDALELVPDPVLMGDLCPQDGREHKDSWGTVYIFKPGSAGGASSCNPGKTLSLKILKNGKSS